MVVGGILLPLLALRYPGIRRQPWSIVVPPFACLPVAVLAELVRLTERMAEWVGSRAHLFLRASEVQELCFFLFVLFYLLVLRRRLLQEAELGGS